MRLKTIKDEDFVNYKKPALFIGTISCGGKCCIEAGIPITICQNDAWRREPVKNIPDEELFNRYITNPLTSSIVLGGLEPFEQYKEVLNLIKYFREIGHCDDDFVIYTGYNKDEILDKIDELKEYKNIIIKYGRYIPGQDAHHDDILGVNLISDNQYAERIS